MEKEEMARQAAANAAKNNQGKLGFLDNIKSFDVEDIWVSLVCMFTFISL